MITIGQSPLPKVPLRELDRLRAIDRYLDIEDLGDHYAIVDTSNIVRQYQVKKGDLIPYVENKVLYDRIHHIPPGRTIDDETLKTIRSMRMERWGKEADFKAEMNKQIETREHSRKSEERTFAEEFGKGMKGLKRFGVIVPGRRDDKNGDNAGITHS